MNALIIGQGTGGGSSSGGSNASVGLNGGPGPTSSTQIGDVVAGVFTAFSASNPLPITGTILANNLSVGPTGSPVPPDATYIGVMDASGNLVGASASNPVRIDPTGTTVQPISGTVAVSNFPATQPVSGTITALQGTSPWIVAGGGTAGAPGTAVLTVQGIVGGTAIPVSGTFFPALQNVNVTQWDTVALGAPSAYGTSPGAVNVIGVNAFITNVPHVISDTGSTTAVTGNVTVVQPTGTNLHVVVDSGSSLTAAVTGTLTNNNAAPAALNNLGVLPAVANATHPTWTEGDQVLLSEDLLGNLRVNVQAGSIVAFQGTNPWIVTGNLTNNNAAPTATLQGILSAIAETAYNTVTYTTGDLVLPVTDLHGALNQDLQAVAGVQLGATAVTAYGTAPAAANVPGVNAFITNTPAVTLASTTITGTVAVTQSTSPWVVSLASTTVTNTVAENLIQVAGVTLGATAVTNFGTAPAAAAVPGVNSSIFAGTTGITATGTSLNVNVTNTAGIAGTLTNNNAAPAANNLGVLSALANAANPTWTEGDQVLLSEDLSGHLRVVATGAAASGATVVGNPVLIAGRDVSNVTQYLPINYSAVGIGAFKNANDGNSNTLGFPTDGFGNFNPFATAGFIYNGTTWDRLRSATIGNNVAATGIAAGVSYGDVTTAAPTYTTGTYSALSLDTAGNLRVSPTAIGTLTNNNAVPGTINVGVLPAVANAADPTWTEGDQVLLSENLSGHLRVQSSGVAATGAAVAGNPVYVAGKDGAGLVQPFGVTLITAATAPTTGNAVLSVNNTTAPSLTTGQSVALQCDYEGNIFTKNCRHSQIATQGTTISASVAATSIMPAQTALYADISMLVFTVAPIATTAIDFTVTLSDGSSTYVFNMNTGVTATGTGSTSLVMPFNPPLRASSTATAWTVQLSTVAVLSFNVLCVAVKQKDS
jgi:hypothetical protein